MRAADAREWTPRMKAKVAFKMLTQLGHAPDEKGIITLKKEGNEDLFDNLRLYGCQPMRKSNEYSSENLEKIQIV